MPIVPVFPDSTGGAAGFDGVVAPSPTTDSKASGVALSAKTFGAFTDPNGLIDNYNAVTTNADGTCSWSGSGLGPYTPTSADGDSGTLELQARDSSNNVLASAIHSYDRAAAGGGSNATLVYEQLFDDVTTGSRSTTGSQVVYAGDGTTPIGTFELTTSGTLSAWTADWSNADGLKLSGVAKGGGSSGTVILAFNAPAGWLSAVDFSNDILVAEVIYHGNALPGNGSIWFGAAPYGSLALAVNDGRDFKVTRAAGAYSWLTERWGNYDSDAVASLGTTAVNANVVFHMELNGGLRTMLEQARSSFVDPADWRTFGWDGRGIGAMLVAVDDDPATERYAAAGGFTFIVAVNNNDAANPGASAIRGIRVWKKGE